ncbi:WbqC family protein [Marinomonas sp. 15G1-11]|uniref:WbqC family protein n=1 Tax=Marinomonas phaeophyticola TaxID=3004091 RepID=A0ABT4JS87_9GAMM|nr:WbqC family protein [Marinomonas sp. 15G1-11]MCZ2721222.1 WbqC family protein [Marinomonas sp. 15G1-11]
MILSVMQPTYLPWLGYFSLIDSADTFVFLDNVKLEKSDWHIRNRIKTKDQALMLSCHVTTPTGRMNATIENTPYIKAHSWKKKHLRSIVENYNKTPYFNELSPILARIYAQEGLDTVAQFNMALIKALMAYMEISTPVFAASDLFGISGVKDERLVSICQTLHCDHYLSPLGARAYIEENSPGGELVKHNIEVFYQNFEHPEYIQQKGEFISHLSAVDCLFNMGPKKTLELIRQATKSPIYYSDLSG